jgi:hypothetical protein
VVRNTIPTVMVTHLGSLLQVITLVEAQQAEEAAAVE